MKKKFVSISGFFLLVLSVFVFTACDKDSKSKIPEEQKVVIKLHSPASLTMVMGQSAKLEAIAEPDVDLTWSSSDASVVKVNQYGELIALKEGNAQIIISAEKAENVTVQVIVGKTELPLMKFVRNNLDEDILNYEKLVGRTFFRGINYLNRASFAGYMNLDMPTIPIAIYSVANKTHKLVMCYSKESLDNPERTKKMMLDAGFGEAENTVLEPSGDKALHWKKGSVEAILFAAIHKQYGTYTILQFMEEGQYPKEEQLADVLHPVIEDAKDFPSMEALKGSLEDVEAFEKNLGLRIKGKGSNPENPAYFPKEESADLSNLDAVFYIRKPQQEGELPYFNTRLNCIPRVVDVQSESFNKWIRLNCGEGGEWKFNKDKTVAQLLTKTHLLVVYMSNKYILMQIFDPAVLDKSSK